MDEQGLREEIARLREALREADLYDDALRRLPGWREHAEISIEPGVPPACLTVLNGGRCTCGALDHNLSVLAAIAPAPARTCTPLVPGGVAHALDCPAWRDEYQQGLAPGTLPCPPAPALVDAVRAGLEAAADLVEGDTGRWSGIRDLDPDAIAAKLGGGR